MILKLLNILLSKVKKKKKEILKTFGLSPFITKSYFSNNGSQNFLIFELIYKVFTMPAGLRDTIVE